jgi:cytochrome c oxidase subunit 2
VRQGPGAAAPRRSRTARERRARLITAAAVLLLAAGLIVLGLPSTEPGVEVDLVARQPAAGGWSRERIVVRAGERVRLRIRSDDVVHGFAIGRLGVDAGAVEPGKATTVEFVADRPGEYTYYCTHWCDPHHPRMRGVLEVRAAGGESAPPSASPASPASDLTLAHLDAPRAAAVVPAARPLASRGLERYTGGCAACHGGRGQGGPDGPAVQRWGRLVDQSPVELFQRLRGEASPAQRPEASRHAAGTATAHARVARDWSDQAAWDAVAYLWSLGATPAEATLGRALYAKHCAACHGVGGRGDGPGGKYQPKQPADFTAPPRMLAGTSALYLAKIRRGGMGTGMPYWGSIFTEEELRALVDQVWSYSLGTRE